jgi:hypothetical protein
MMPHPHGSPMRALGFDAHWGRRSMPLRLRLPREPAGNPAAKPSAIDGAQAEPNPVDEERYISFK